jgi:thiol-disulfide isomerase/thioredoxin
MADVATKINIKFNLHRSHGVSLFPNKSAVFSASSSLKFRSSPRTDFYGGRLVFGDRLAKPNTRNPPSGSLNAQMGIGIMKAQKWWEKGLQPNMKEVTGAQDLVDSLRNAGDKLVVVDFFSPGCGGCRALHPKLCQLAEMNPGVQFLQVNSEEHKSMCYSLNVHVLPFFRFYKGAHGRVCSFSCTNATIKKFKDALAKYGADCCSLGPAKGLEEKELLALAANKDLSFSYIPESEPSIAVPSQEEILKEAPVANLGPPLPLPRPLSSTASSAVAAQNTENNKSLTSSGR